MLGIVSLPICPQQIKYPLNMHRFKILVEVVLLVFVERKMQGKVGGWREMEMGRRKEIIKLVGWKEGLMRRWFGEMKGRLLVRREKREGTGWRERWRDGRLNG